MLERAIPRVLIEIRTCSNLAATGSKGWDLGKTEASWLSFKQGEVLIECHIVLMIFSVGQYVER